MTAPSSTPLQCAIFNSSGCQVAGAGWQCGCHGAGAGLLYHEASHGAGAGLLYHEASHCTGAGWRRTFSVHLASSVMAQRPDLQGIKQKVESRYLHPRFLHHHHHYQALPKACSILLVASVGAMVFVFPFAFALGFRIFTGVV